MHKDRWALSCLPPPGSYYLQTRSSNWLPRTPSASRGMHSLVDPCWKSCRAAGSFGVVSPGAQLAWRPLMWCHGLCEDMAGLSRPTDWAEAAIWLLCAQMEQILITRLLIQIDIDQAVVERCKTHQARDVTSYAY
ncbi:hypothetical protein WJX79_010237 [Trebouxia sp. C0005]